MLEARQKNRKTPRFQKLRKPPKENKKRRENQVCTFPFRLWLICYKRWNIEKFSAAKRNCENRREVRNWLYFVRVILQRRNQKIDGSQSPSNSRAPFATVTRPDIIRYGEITPIYDQNRIVKKIGLLESKKFQFLCLSSFKLSQFEGESSSTNIALPS